MCYFTHISLSLLWCLLSVTVPLKLMGQDRPTDASQVLPFTIKVGDDVLHDLRERLSRARWPDQIEGTSWEYGVPVSYMKELVKTWQTSFNWRNHEKRLNEIPQFLTRIDGLDIHFMHIRSREQNALPLLLVHGWPGSFVEFMKLIGPLTDPVAHGGKPEDAFHLVIPSLPGFGFSSRPAERGWSNQRMAEVFAKLMARLGYERYGAQGGDWGGGIVSWLASADGGHCIGAHNNFPSASRPKDNPEQDVTQQEMARVESRAKELRDHYGYSAIQSTRPLTISYALNDSPVGLAAWIVDKFWAWSDHAGDLNKCFTHDELLTNIMIYWVNGSLPSSVRIYYEWSHNPARPKTMSDFKSTGRPAPIGYALFPKEINVPPRAWVERSQGRKLLHWTEMPRGGHFAAMEQPELLLKDIRLFFGKVQQTQPGKPEKTQPKVLFYSDPQSSDNNIVRRPKSGGLSFAEQQFAELSRGVFNATVSQDASLITAAKLKEFDAVIFFTAINPPADKAALVDWVKSGGAFAGIHSTANTFQSYAPFGEMLGAAYESRPWRTREKPLIKARMLVSDTAHPATRHLGSSFEWEDDLYLFRRWDKNNHVLLRYDPASLDMTRVKPPGRDLPIAWTRTHHKGRVFYTALGDPEHAWKDPRYRTHLIEGIRWTMSKEK